MSRATSKSLKKFCSLLTYVEHKNRDLYDAIHDLCLSGMFSTRQGRSITFLMPDSKSPMCTKIINAAYSKDPNIAVDLIKACLIPLHINDIDAFSKFDEGKFTNMLMQELKVETPSSTQVILENGGATIIADTTFQPLYNTSRFGVFIIKSGEINTNNPVVERKSKSKKMDTFEGGFENEYVAGGGPVMNNKSHKRKITKYEFIKHMFKSDISRVKNSDNALAAFFTKQNYNFNVFVIAANSLIAFMSDKEEGDKMMWHPNPICVCINICKLDDTIFNQWMSFDDVDIDYSYNAYKKHITKCPEVNTSSIINQIIDLSKNKDVRGIMKVVNKQYEENPNMLLFDEAMFVMNRYLIASIAGDCKTMQTYFEIFIGHYCGATATPMLMSESHSNDIHIPVLCKMFEFIRSDSFMWPIKHTGRNTLIVADKNTPIDLSIDVLDFSNVITLAFNNM